MFWFSWYVDNMSLYKMFLFEQNPLSYLKVVSKDESVAFLLPLGVGFCKLDFIKRI